jgi:hypothetical protein
LVPSGKNCLSGRTEKTANTGSIGSLGKKRWAAVGQLLHSQAGFPGDNFDVAAAET